MAAKVTELAAGVHSLAISVAPVTAWELYDSIYTERYMSTPQLNPAGYASSDIANVTNFGEPRDGEKGGMHYLAMHGTGDDNVHFANSARLVDMLTQEHVRGWRFRMFTDSDHSIYKRSANREVFEEMTTFLVEKWGVGARRRAW